MPPPARSAKRNPERFDPSILARSVIAIPLLNKIEAELETTRRIEEAHPDIRKGHNAAIIFRPEFANEPEAAAKILRKLIKQTTDDLRPKNAQRVDDPDPEIGRRVRLAQLDGPVIRQLLARDALEEKPVIENIWPQRFDVIIDINLEFKLTAHVVAEAGLARTEADEPDPRTTAKLLIEKYIGQAKRECGVDDPDQEIDKLKSDPSKQYVFARLQSDVIQRLAWFWRPGEVRMEGGIGIDVLVVREVRMPGINPGIHHGPDNAAPERGERLMRGIGFDR